MDYFAERFTKDELVQFRFHALLQRLWMVRLEDKLMKTKDSNSYNFYELFPESDSEIVLVGTKVYKMNTYTSIKPIKTEKANNSYAVENLHTVSTNLFYSDSISKKITNMVDNVFENRENTIRKMTDHQKSLFKANDAVNDPLLAEFPRTIEEEVNLDGVVCKVTIEVEAEFMNNLMPEAVAVIYSDFIDPKNFVDEDFI